MVNLDWTRWIWASISKHFDDLKSGIPLYLEGFDLVQVPPKEGAELRMNGPFFRNPSGTYWVIDIDINILLQVTPNNEDNHKLWRIAGIFIDAMTSIIEVFKYGDGEGDDQSLFGCFKIKASKGDEIILSNFGRVDPDIAMIRSAISALYRMELTL